MTGNRPACQQPTCPVCADYRAVVANWEYLKRAIPLLVAAIAGLSVLDHFL